ncbi:hypothetical protein ACFPFX_37320 [Streptomyces mauvecolor]|uniref:Uncharacterized protein n=1 Tax=Streptomyces mauvecolor TaxID=58345 RepID=A0ABV9UZF4_9ACTN
MSEAEAIVPSGIPQFTGDLDSLDHDTALLTSEAGAFRDAGAGIHSHFQSTAAFYKAPEADQLFATTAPVAAKTATFAGQLEKVAGALSAYSQEVRPLAKKLEDLQRQAFAFTATIAGDDHWRRDEKKRDRNDGLKDEVQATLEAFYEAEITCHNKITALVGGSTLVLGRLSGGQMLPKGTSAYGASADDLNHLDNAPWGTYAEPEYTGLSWLGHQVKSFVWDGFIVDGIWGTVKGIDILLGCNGSDAAGEAWKGLAKVVTGLAIAITPGANALFWATPDKMMPTWFRDSRTALKETGKALIAYDEWGKNPARAAGGVTFNVLTTVFTGGAGAAAKGGAVAKTVSVLGKVGRVVDPMTYVFSAGKFGVGKVADVFKGLKGLSLGPLADAAHLQPDGTVLKFSDEVPVIKGDVIEWPNGSRLDLKENTVTLPDGTKAAAHIELSAADRAMLEHNLPHHEPAMTGAQPGESAASRSGGGLPPRADHAPPGQHATEQTRPPSASGGPHGVAAGDVHVPSQHGAGHDGGTATSGSHPGGHDGGHHMHEANGERWEDSHHGEEPHGGHEAEHGNGEGGEANHSRPALPPGQADLTLDQVRRLRDKRTRWSTAEDYFRQLYGGGAERHFPVPTNSHPLYPVEAVGGRKVDVPVDLPDGRTLAVEIKTYQEYRTIKLDGGGHQTIKVEVPLSKHIKEQIHKDLALRRADPGYDPRWVFTHAGPSAELRNYLIRARIIFVEYGPAPKLK